LSTSINTQGLVDSRYRILKTGALLFLCLDIFYFFGCYLYVNLAGKAMWQFPGLLQYDVFSISPVLLRYILIGYAIVSLPAVLHGKKLALVIDVPTEEQTAGVPSLGSIESAFAHYSRTIRISFIMLSLVNLLAGAFFVTYGQFWVLLLVACIGFFNKLVAFPGRKGFNRWIWRALYGTGEAAAT